MPMPSQIWCFFGHRNIVTCAGSNVAIAARTEVHLGCLVGLDEPHLAVDDSGELGIHQPNNAHTTAATQIVSATATRV